MKYIVITSIQAPTPSVRRIAELAQRFQLGVLIVGDRKSPNVAWPDNVEFMSLEEQHALGGSLPAQIPENHYARKNVGYLALMRSGAEALFDTDDDNAPLDHWQVREPACTALRAEHAGWLNVYRLFSSHLIWPRGLPLERIRDPLPAISTATSPVQSPIQQGLVNGSPDVDAVWRLVLDAGLEFDVRPSVVLAPGTWCPFNSQSTWWFPQAYPLLYLPSFVSFRMTDIWRSFIAQRCLWELGLGIVFHAPDMVQERNPHNLLSDFRQEVPGYLENERMRGLLEVLALSSSADAIGGNLHRCYEALVSAGIIPKEEMALVEGWLADLPGTTARAPAAVARPA